MRTVLVRKSEFSVPVLGGSDADHQIVIPESGGLAEKVVSPVPDVLVQLDFTLMVDHAEIHFGKMQVHSAVKFVGLIVESHLDPPWKWCPLSQS